MDVVSKLVFASGLPEEDIRRKIDEKRLALGISEDGAAFIVAQDIGIALAPHERLRLENIVPGMQNVDVIAKVTHIFPPRDWTSAKGSGRIASVILADESDSIRLTLWNDEVDKIEGIRQDDVVRVRGFVKEDGTGQPELRLGRHGLLTTSEERLDAVVARRAAERTSIAALRDGNAKEVRAALVQIFESNLFYETCPQCRARLREEHDYKCEEHGDVSPSYGLVVSGILDDGTGTIRAVFFNEQAERLLGMTAKDAKQLFDRKKKLAAVLERVPLGKDLIVAGRVRRNAIFDRTEMIVNDVKELDLMKEIEGMRS